jgi:hypothetical protein
VERSLQECTDYIATKLSSGGAEVKYSLEKEVVFPFVVPMDPGTGATRGQEITFESELKSHLKEMKQYRVDC